TGLIRNVMSAIECPLHEVVFGSLTSRSRRQRSWSSLGGYWLGRSRWRFVPVLAQIDEHHAGDESKDNETTHGSFWSIRRAIIAQKTVRNRRLSNESNAPSSWIFAGQTLKPHFTARYRASQKLVPGVE